MNPKQDYDKVMPAEDHHALCVFEWKILLTIYVGIRIEEREEANETQIASSAEIKMYS